MGAGTKSALPLGRKDVLLRGGSGEPRGAAVGEGARTAVPVERPDRRRRRRRRSSRGAAMGGGAHADVLVNAARPPARNVVRGLEM